MGKVLVDGEEKEFIERKRRHSVSSTSSSTSSTNEDASKQDPYAGIDVASILAPVMRPEDAAKNQAIGRIFQDTALRDMAQQAVDIIEAEQKSAAALDLLMDIFLGENPKYLKIDNMKLPDYDHQLVDGETNEEMKLQSKRHKNDYVIESALDNGSTNSVKTEEYLALLQTTSENKRITRNVDLSYQEVDPFFALPQVEPDPNDGLDPRFAEELRQVTQVTLQRNREYIRLLQKIRMGLIRAERLKDQVYKWCKEMNGEFEGRG